MMKKRTTLLGITLLVGILSIPVLTWAQGWGKGQNRMGYGGGVSAACWNNSQGKDNLTEEQRTQLDKLSRKFYDETAQLKNEIWAKSAALNTFLNSSNPDADKATALQKEISDLRALQD